MDQVSYKNVKRGTRRHYTRIKDEVYKPYGDWRNWSWSDSSSYVHVHKIVRGQKQGRCSCYNELPKKYCRQCQIRSQWKAGELGLDDSVELLEE